MKHYHSSIPTSSRERVVATFVDGPQKYKSEYRVHGKIVGIRLFYRTGDLEYECPLENGLTHGIVYRCDEPGKLLSAEPYCNGLPHGVAKQWAADGKLLGRYTMKRGTGLDLWWNQAGEHGSAYLSEARFLNAGKWHGFEWWLNEDQRSVWEERHFRNDEMHGIERSWNARGRLRRGYPRYWVTNRRVTKEQYLRECAMDDSLPRFREIDNAPERNFPQEVKRALQVHEA